MVDWTSDGMVDWTSDGMVDWTSDGMVDWTSDGMVDKWYSWLLLWLTNCIVDFCYGWQTV